MQLAYKSVDVGSTFNEKQSATNGQQDASGPRIQDLTQLIEERFLRLNSLLERHEQRMQRGADSSEGSLMSKAEGAQADVTSLQRSFEIEMQHIRRDLVSQALALKADVDQKKEALTDALNNIHEEQEVMSKRLEATLEKHREQLQASLEDSHKSTCSKTQPKSFEAQLATSQSIIMLLSSLVVGVTASFISQSRGAAQIATGPSCQYGGHESYMANYFEQSVPPMPMAAATSTTAAAEPEFPLQEQPARGRSTKQTQPSNVRAHQWRDAFLTNAPDAQHKPLRCIFWFLDCDYCTNDESEWRTHSMAHFRGQEPPKRIWCTICAYWIIIRGFTDNAWDTYMSHMATHIRNGQDVGHSRHRYPSVNPANQNPPCNTLFIGNLPVDTSEDELKTLFARQRGYKRLCFRTKQNGPMCFVEFKDVSFATKTLIELYGHRLGNSVRGGIQLTFTKTPLGVRTSQTQPAALPSHGEDGGDDGDDKDERDDGNNGGGGSNGHGRKDWNGFEGPDRDDSGGNGTNYTQLNGSCQARTPRAYRPSKLAIEEARTHREVAK